MVFRWSWNESGDEDVIGQIVRKRDYPGSFFRDGVWPINETILPAEANRAADRILSAVRHKEKIFIFGDDDPDGITATHILYDYLERIGSQNHFYHIPNRIAQPHGMQPDFLERMKRERPRLVVTVDVGISSVEAVETLNSIGCDVIITDHHLPPEILPDAFAIVDPHIPGREYPFRYLSGVGVALYLIRRMAEMLGQSHPNSYFVWATIGTIADKVPLVGANRAFCREALRHWVEYRDTNLEFLTRYFPAGTDAASKNAYIANVYKLLSCGRRSGGINLALDMLQLPPCAKPERITQLLGEKANYDQQTLTVLQYLNEIPRDPGRNLLIHFDIDDRIPRSLLGLAASVIAHGEKIPAVFLKRNGDDLICEARCTEGFNLVDAFGYCRDLLIQYGGHAKAAGFTIRPGNKAAFEQRFTEYTISHLLDIEGARKIDIDAVVLPEQIDSTLLSRLESLQPWGQMNPEPVFMIRDVDPQNQEGFIFTGNAPRDPGRYDLVFQVRSLPFLYVLDYHKADIA